MSAPPTPQGNVDAFAAAVRDFAAVVLRAAAADMRAVARWLSKEQT